MTSRTPNLPGVERQRGNQHIGNAVKQEGMYCHSPQVLCAWRSQQWQLVGTLPYLVDASCRNASELKSGFMSCCQRRVPAWREQGYDLLQFQKSRESQTWPC